MLKSFARVCALVFALAVPDILFAQAPLPVYIGGGISVAYNSHTLNMPVYLDQILCGTFDGGHSILPNGFLLFEKPFGTLNGLWMAPRLHLNSLGAKLTTPAIDQANGRNPIDSSLVPTSREHRYDASILTLGADLFVKYPLSGTMFLFGGPSLSYLLRREAVQTEAITQPSSAVFLESGSSTRNIYSGQIPNSNSLLATFTLGGSVDVPLSKQVTLAPELSITAPLTSITSNSPWHIWSFAIGTALKFNLAREQSLEVVHETHVDRPTSEITATVKLSGVRDSAGTEIEMPNPQLRVEEFVRRESHPTLNYIFFDEGSWKIPARYRTLSTDLETASFSDSAFIGKNALDVYHETLNILGKRLQSNPSTTITLTGSNANSGTEANATDLSKRRAEAVKQYFVSAWKVDPSRIAVQAVNLPANGSTSATKEGAEENRRVEITSSDPAFLDPLVIEEVDRTMNPPKLRLRTSLYSKLPLTKNVLALTQGDRTLLELNSAKNVQDWTPTPSELPQTDSPLLASLSLKDQEGAELVAKDSAVVEQLTIKRKREERVKDKVIEHYNLITFDFDKAELDERSQRIISEIAKSVTANDMIKLTGYTDMTGDRDHNLKLSEQRAKNVETALEHAAGAKSATVKYEERGEGENNLVDNRLPEGRFLSRTVFVRIERPVQ